MVCLIPVLIAGGKSVFLEKVPKQKQLIGGCFFTWEPPELAPRHIFGASRLHCKSKQKEHAPPFHKPVAIRKRPGTSFAIRLKPFSRLFVERP
ncbi:MAG: hypothetical protein N3D11_15280 [Candidatus Sumerlaeia bacterium]|nr:hypothetical protein [Candidatus Sumerlaeia bacterium]